MKKQTIFTVISLFVLTFSVCAVTVGFAAPKTYTGIGASASVSSTGLIPLTPDPTLDDFNSRTSLNRWGDITGTWASTAGDPPVPTASCTSSFAAGYGGSGYSLRLDYNVTNSASYAGYFSKMGGGSLAGYTKVSFLVKGAVGNEFFKIELKNTSTTRRWDAQEGTNYYRNSASVYITDFLDGGVTTSWQKVTIPLANFTNLDGFVSMKEIVFTFENSQNVTNGTAATGTIYIDDISFETTSTDIFRIDHFGDKLGVCSLGGNIGNMPNEYPANPGASYIFSNTVYYYYANSLRSSYIVSDSPWWAGHYFIFGGGNADSELMAVERPEKMGWIAVPGNFSDYNYICFAVKANTDVQNPRNIKVEFTDGGGNKSYRVSGIGAASWTYLRIPLSNFTGLIRSSIKKMSFVYEYNTATWKEGVVYIDYIQFEK